MVNPCRLYGKLWEAKAGRPKQAADGRGFWLGLLASGSPDGMNHSIV
jgi:hypothetical protein